jgi:peptide-methionine (S)-S-oxide reductase
MSAIISSPTSGAKTVRSEFLVLGGGCFWCTEAAYELLPGVKSVVSGYSGGETKNPSYDDVCSGDTGHTEVIRIEYDPTQVSLDTLLDFFWTIHDPTTLNRQGADTGTQYRSAIYYETDEQKNAAEKSKTIAQAKFSVPIVTEIARLGEFYPAEEYHQDYFRKNPHAGYCRVVIKPKLDKAKKTLAQGAIV